MATRWVGADGDLRRNAISRRARALGRLLDAEAVILFGSLARGDHREHSDMDLMAVRADSSGVRALRKYNHETDVVVTTATALKESVLRPWSVEAEAVRHGWVLYDHDERTIPWRTTAAGWAKPARRLTKRMMTRRTRYSIEESIRLLRSGERSLERLKSTTEGDHDWIARDSLHATEMALKAWLAAKERAVPHVHDVNRLLHDARRNGLKNMPAWDRRDLENLRLAGHVEGYDEPPYVKAVDDRLFREIAETATREVRRQLEPIWKAAGIDEEEIVRRNDDRSRERRAGIRG
jgi:HEPN domain-containing protein/predicted nucleotidyltransferase